MPDAILAIDAGTTSVRTLIFDADWNILGRAQKTLPLHTPQPGHVEQSPDELWKNTLTLTKQALTEAQLKPSDIAALGITSQRASCLIWEKETGAPLTQIISWQDLRGTERALELGKLGFPLFPASAACKLESAIDSIPEGRTRMNNGELCWGNVDSFLAFKLSGGTIHATDLSQACATGYLDFETEQWLEPLIKVQDLNPSFFPTLVDTSAVLGETDPVILGASIPISAIVGDQQSAAIAQDCNQPGDLKFTYGTSGTCNVHTGNEILMIPGTYPLVLQRQHGRTEYCIEAMIITAGSTLDWINETFRLPESTTNLDLLLKDTPDSAEVLLLPALQGIGSPHACPDQRGHIARLTRSTTPEHVVYAALEGIAFRTREILEHLAKNSDLPIPETIRIDGGLTRSATFTQILADVLQKTVSVSRHPEAAALGAAQLAQQALCIESNDSKDEPASTLVKPNTKKKKHHDLQYGNWKAHFDLA